MCGRFAAARKLQELAKFYNAQPMIAQDMGGYNICPTEQATIVLEDRDQNRTIESAQFGITTTSYGKTFPLLNLQSEKIENREDFKKRRCVIPADGFYEWEKVTLKDKQPHYFSLKNGFMSFAGVWRKTDTGLAFAILTTNANELLQPIHSRMPVILSHNAIGQWLASDSDKNTLKELLEPYPAGLMQSWKVSKAVNSPKCKEASCINSL